jgi:hypothetical protein
MNFNNASGNIKKFFGSDMKFMQICLGLGLSTGEYACPWCKVHKKDRADMSKPWDFYHLTGNVRTINEIKDIYNGHLSQKKLGKGLQKDCHNFRKTLQWQVPFVHLLTIFQPTKLKMK